MWQLGSLATSGVWNNSGYDTEATFVNGGQVMRARGLFTVTEKVPGSEDCTFVTTGYEDYKTPRFMAICRFGGDNLTDVRIKHLGKYLDVDENQVRGVFSRMRVKLKERSAAMGVGWDNTVISFGMEELAQKNLGKINIPGVPMSIGTEVQNGNGIGR